jgi:hypothetical protein
MKVKYLISCVGSAGCFPAGSIHEIPDAKAIHLAGIGRVEIIEETKETPKDEVSDKQPASGRANKSKRGKRPSKN